ncbi:HAD family hydrolase [Streptococcus porcinus]|uniref:HAD-IIB family hydrolase n=1 Tax=Streptococcus porcinus TaxID=1340 RepID=UPI00195F6A0C|nr:HAD family hydrolase [Streptococcus porcinus]
MQIYDNDGNEANHKKILVFDLDGTIVYNGTNIEPMILEFLLSIQDSYEIIFASARPIRDMLPLLIDFQKNQLIGGNGSMIRKDNNISLVARIPEKAMITILHLIHKLDLDYIVDYSWDYSARIRDINNAILEKLDSGRLAENVNLAPSNVSKVILFNISRGMVANFEEMDCINVLYHEHVHELVITSKGVDKYSALTLLIDSKPYYAFGNDKNDIALLNNSEKGYAIEYSFNHSGNVQDITKNQMIDSLSKLDIFK